MAIREGRFSSMRFNEWICVIAQYEKAIMRIGRQIYQGYSRGLVDDFSCIEMCKEISDNFAEAKAIRAEMEEEYERDALDGLTVAEAKETEKVHERSQANKLSRSMKVRFTKFMGRVAINRKVAVHRNKVREISRDLGLRAMAVHEENPILKMKGHRNLCLLAERLQADADAKWADIVEDNAEGKGGGGLSFHTIFVSFIASFANFSKGTHLGKGLMKLFKYDAKEEQEKLTKQFEGSNAAEALVEQLAEVEEPELDVAKELDNMERDFEETPEEWNLPPRQMTDGKWVPDTEQWNPENEEIEEELDTEPEPFHPPVIGSAAPPAASAPSAPTPKPVVVRKKAPESGWGSSSETDNSDSWTPDDDPSASPPPAIGDSFAAPTRPAAPVTPAASKETEVRKDPFLAKPPATASPSETWSSPAAKQPSTTDSWGSSSSSTNSWDTDASKSWSTPATPQPSLSGWTPADDEPPVANTPPLTKAPVIPHDKDDDLLPDFLRERKPESSKTEDEPFIPEMPTFLADDDAPNLELRPFGKDKKKDSDDDKPFIPQMPDL